MWEGVWTRSYIYNILYIRKAAGEEINIAVCQRGPCSFITGSTPLLASRATGVHFAGGVVSKGCAEGGFACPGRTHSGVSNPSPIPEIRHERRPHMYVKTQVRTLRSRRVKPTHFKIQMFRNTIQIVQQRPYRRSQRERGREASTAPAGAPPP